MKSEMIRTLTVMTLAVIIMTYRNDGNDQIIASRSEIEVINKKAGMSSSSKPEKTELSKMVLQMKFMKRTASRVAEDDKAAQVHIDDEHWHLALPDSFKQQKQKYATEESLQKLEELTPGRQSFKGFNPEIERLAASVKEEQELEEVSRREAENSVSDTQMTERYSSLVGTISKKFKSKKGRNGVTETANHQAEPKAKKKKFMKPQD